jgi:hypothetical protein
VLSVRDSTPIFLTRVLGSIPKDSLSRRSTLLGSLHTPRLLDLPNRVREEGMNPLDAEDPGEMGMEEMEKTLLHLEAIVMMKILLPLAMRRMTSRNLVYFVPILGHGQG